MPTPGEITIELYGVPRQRAGVREVSVSAGTLGEAISELGRRFPALAAECFAGGELRPGYVVNVNGDRFVRDPATPLHVGDCVMLLSADAGG